MVTVHSQVNVVRRMFKVCENRALERIAAQVSSRLNIGGIRPCADIQRAVIEAHTLISRVLVFSARSA